MKPGFAWGLCGLVLSLVGCQDITYTVKITNNSTVTTDLSITSVNGSPQFVSNLGPGASTTVTHTATAFADVDVVTVASGNLIGNLLSPIDSTCTAKVTAHDIVNVVKGPTGQLTCTVTPDTGPPPVTDRQPLFPRDRLNQ